ncbi:Sigma-54 interaction domain-containing protein [bacterium JGI 053]|nr:Sigma-54 interaction domain-containing protein [bacterium JGI 053]
MHIPLFRYQWEGNYRFESQRGADWKGCDSDAWHMADYRPPSGREAYACLGKVALPLRAEAVLVFEEELRKLLADEDVLIPSDLGFLKWLAGTSDEYRIEGGLSTLLNHIALSQGLQQYEVVSTIVENCLSAELRGLREREPCWLYDSQEGTIPFVEEDLLVHAHFFLKPVGKKGNKPEYSGVRANSEIKEACRWLRSRRILHKYEVTSFHTDQLKDSVSVKIRVRDQVCWVPYERGLRAYGLPIPGQQRRLKTKEPAACLTPEVCVASPTVRKSLSKLHQIWQDRSVRAVLVSAPPGSGKEQFTKSIPYALGRRLDEVPTRALSTASVDEDIAAIFGRHSSDGRKTDGLLNRGLAKAIFIDEAHYPEEDVGVRAALLRPLENGEYSPVGSAETISCKDILFLFASSLPLTADGDSSPIDLPPKEIRKSLRNIPPVDFWTRVTHSIEFPHPLSGLEADEVTHSLVGFFWHFWWDRALDHFGVESFPFENDDGRPAAMSAVLEAHLTTMLSGGVVNPAADQFASCFQRYLERTGTKPTNVSLRGIRSIVARLFSVGLNDLLEGREVLNPGTLLKRVEEAVESVIPLASI